MKRSKKIIIFSAIVIFCVIIATILISTMPNLEKRTWILSYAQQGTSPCFVVAHNPNYDFSDDESGLFESSQAVELMLEAKDGKLLLIDKTNEKTYEGTYTVNSSWRGKFRIFKNKIYTVVIDGLEGTANFSTNRTLFVSIDGYCLYFEIQ